ncbi:MAG TPA: ABC transporter permease [Actinotalea sp.]|jgi:ABC-2 type transport system permease protein
MSLRLTGATAGRVLRQLRNDPRTIGILLVLPCVLIGLIAWMFEGTPVLNSFGPLLVGLFPLVVMFIVTSVATLRERQSGTLERLMTTPTGKADILLGYMVAFGVVAIVQALVLIGFSLWVAGMEVAGELWLVVVVAVLDAILGTALGLAASAIARTEFQAVQLMPVVIFPQLIASGLIMPRAEMPGVLEAVSRVLPLTYGMEALQKLAKGGGFEEVRGAVGVVVLFIVGALVLGAATLRRRTP